ncbi:Interferon-induced protein 44 [Triplophysa tibetana]|uniref:Interferon-induced protein 44 n=1 Tax=Triplophysa tibetana TaxID=1572043 RepID=A0A5A9PAI5_9TELE|nr:Interferon-induced protein 44 [Triplophysa tibetana]
MSAVVSSLSKQQEMKLRSMFCQSRLSLLFKASVHGYHSASFHQKCDRQGPTVIVAYNNSGYVFGAFTSCDYAQTGRDIVDNKAFLFSFNCNMNNNDPLRVVSGNPLFSFNDGNTSPNFESLVFLHNNIAAVYSNPGIYQFDPQQMHGNNVQLTEFEVYRVEDFGGLMDKPWRKFLWNFERREEILGSVSEWKPSLNSVKQAQILLVGPVGAGKSSFFNSINSVFKGYVSTQANTGTAGSSLTTQFRTYRIKVGKTGKFLPFMLCDTMGMEEGANAGLDIDDFTSILKGHIQDRYQFNPSVPLQDDSPHFHRSASLKDKIHCVLYVMDASKVKLMSKKMVEKFVTLRRKANQLGIPQLVLLTKVDEACPLVEAELKDVYQSHYIKRTMQEVSANIGVSLTAVVPVKNYSEEVELDPEMDILLLNALNLILRATDGYFDNQGEDTKSV